MKPRDLSDPAVRRALFAHYDIEVGTYRELKNVSKPGYQREHFLPHSNFMARSKGANEARGKVPILNSFDGYTEDDAITYFVYDDQSRGTEHRYLTDIEKSFAKGLNEKGEHASVNEWLDYMEAETAKSLSMDTIERAPEVYAARIPAEDADDVAKALRIECETKLDAMGVDKNAPMSNLVGGGDAPSNQDIGPDDDF